MSNKETTSRTLIVILSLCFVCSVIVSTAAVVLKPIQETNKALDFKRNILAAAGMLEEGVSVEEQFKQITTKTVDFASDTYASDVTVEQLAQETALTSEQDIAKIGARADYSKVYLVEANGQLEKIILPIKGYGLWSTLYGFMALEADTNTIVGLGFYQHGETPGLGGEVDNPKWKSLWVGKEIYAADGSVAITITKGPAPVGDINKVDGLSGATLTSKGVDNLIKFWMGDDGYGPFLSKLKDGEA